jgi:primosomal protein N' (replication factor Y)
VVWHHAAPTRAPAHRLKPIAAGLDAPPLRDGLRRFLVEVAATTLTPLGTVLRLAVSVPAALEPEAPKLAWRLADASRQGTGAAQRRVVERLLAAGAPLLATTLAKAAKAPAATLRAMAERGLLEPVALAADPGPPRPDPGRPGVALEPAQAAAAARLAALVRAGSGVALLDGVPGSGKTEVYLEAVATALAAGRSALVLLPEIALTAQWLERFEHRFGGAPVAWHSAVGPAQRRRRWRWIADGRARVVVGARSALFLPIADLGLIVVDEEHDPSFKQEDGAVYHARDLALRRAAIDGCAVVLASATPSLETARAAGVVGQPAHEGAEPAPGWWRIALPERFGPAAMPAVELVDLRRAPPPRGRFLAPPLAGALAQGLESGGQALLFLNRRGYAPLTLCRACGHRLRCPSCAAWLTAHRLRRRLVCHHCGWNRPEPEHCPACGGLDALTLSGPGVERVAEEVAARFPTARTAVMTSDTVGTAEAAARLVHAVAAHEIDVLIGTQMVAKGHHFPDLVLVGVVDADLALTGGDLRAAERTFQLLYQVAGRAGRAERAGRVLIQTHLPEHPVMQAIAKGDRDAFLALELDERRAAAMPPFGRLAALIVSGPDKPKVEGEARRVARAAPTADGLTVLGPAPAPLALLRGRWRERLLVKAAPAIDLPPTLRAWLAPLRLAPGVDLTVDVDPQSFL